MSLEDENSRVLDLVQASLGSISTNVRCVELTSHKGGVELRFLLEQDSEEDRNEIDGIAFEFYALQSVPIDVKTCVAISAGPLHECLLHQARRIYIRKEHR